MSLIGNLKNHLLNIPGRCTNRRIVVIESDDWGSIRIPSVRVLKILRENGIRVDDCAYMLNDCLESNEDMDELLSTLNSKPKRPVITANFLTANPNFNRIRSENFTNYYYESVLETLKNYPSHEKVYEYWKSGIKEGVFHPQLHGREHLNISRWMSDLRNGVTETRLAFDLHTFAISAHVVRPRRWSYQAAFDLGEGEDQQIYGILNDAVTGFHNLFGFLPVTFIAPNYTWGEDLERASSRLGIKFLQGGNVQRLPINYNRRQAVQRHWYGERNKFDQQYLIRNASFEPYSNPDKDWVSLCLKDVSSAFLWRKPAVISMHRVNFVGSINPKNRKTNLTLFSRLIDEIIKRWPDVEFMSSVELTKQLKY